MAEKPPARTFKNKKTGVIWEVADPATLKRVLADPQTYKELMGDKPSDTSTASKK